MRELQRRLAAAGFLAPGSAEDSTYCAKTHAAVVAFQDSHGLRTSGECDELTWSALIEASWSLGERILYVRSPNIRGDDVAELQAILNRLGFACGRVDGIFGPLAQQAIKEFQTNIGVEPTGICGPDLVTQLQMLVSQSGTGPGVAVVRESVELGDVDVRDDARVVIGYFDGAARVGHDTARKCADRHRLTTTVDFDAAMQARAANSYSADVYIGFEMAPDSGCFIQYYEVPTFVSVGGRNLAARIARAIADRIPELTVHTQGIRHPVLRETRMPAVLCSLAPADIVSLKTNAIAMAVSDALDAWREDPLREL